MKTTALVVHAAKITLDRLASLPDSPEARELRKQAINCIAEAQGWLASAAVAEQRYALMRDLLLLYAAVGQLARAMPIEEGLDVVEPVATGDAFVPPASQGPT